MRCGGSGARNSCKWESVRTIDGRLAEGAVAASGGTVRGGIRGTRRPGKSAGFRARSGASLRPAPAFQDVENGAGRACRRTPLPGRGSRPPPWRHASSGCRRARRRPGRNGGSFQRRACGAEPVSRAAFFRGGGSACRIVRTGSRPASGIEPDDVALHATELHQADRPPTALVRAVLFPRLRGPLQVWQK